MEEQIEEFLKEHNLELPEENIEENISKIVEKFKQEVIVNMPEQEKEEYFEELTRDLIKSTILRLPEEKRKQYLKTMSDDFYKIDIIMEIPVEKRGEYVSVVSDNLDKEFIIKSLPMKERGQYISLLPEDYHKVQIIESLPESERGQYISLLSEDFDKMEIIKNLPESERGEYISLFSEDFFKKEIIESLPESERGQYISLLSEDFDKMEIIKSLPESERGQYIKELEYSFNREEILDTLSEEEREKYSKLLEELKEQEESYEKENWTFLPESEEEIQQILNLPDGELFEYIQELILLDDKENIISKMSEEQKENYLKYTTDSFEIIDIIKTLPKEKREQYINLITFDQDKVEFIRELSIEKREKYIEELNDEELKLELIKELPEEERTKLIPKVMILNTKKEIILSLSEENQDKYIGSITDDFEKENIMSELPDKMKVKYLPLIESELYKRELLKEIKDKDLILSLDEADLNLYRKEMENTKFIKDNIETFMAKSGIDTEEDVKKYKEILSRLEEKNADIYKTINFKILDSKYVELFGESKINQLSCYPKVQKKLLTLGDKELKLTVKCVEQLEKNENTGDWTPLADKVITNLSNGEYNELVQNIGDIETLNIKDLTKIIQKPNMFNIRQVEEIPKFEEIRKKQCEEWINSTYIINKKTAVLEKLFGQDIKEAQEIVSKYEESIDKIENKECKTYVKALKEIITTNDKQMLEKIFDKTKETKNIDLIQMERTLKTEYGKLLNNDLLTTKELEKNEEYENVYEAGTDFKILMTSVGAYSREETKNYKEDWNRPAISSQHFCTSYIRNDMLRYGTHKFNLLWI